jgi:hypothetical protein
VLYLPARFVDVPIGHDAQPQHRLLRPDQLALRDVEFLVLHALFRQLHRGPRLLHVPHHAHGKLPFRHVPCVGGQGMLRDYLGAVLVPTPELVEH